MGILAKALAAEWQRGAHVGIEVDGAVLRGLRRAVKELNLNRKP